MGQTRNRERKEDAAVHEIALTADGTGLPPYYPAETAFGAWSAAEQAAFTGVSPAQWVALADAL